MHDARVPVFALGLGVGLRWSWRIPMNIRLFLVSFGALVGGAWFRSSPDAGDPGFDRAGE
jgi:hypothetical protein